MLALWLGSLFKAIIFTWVVGITQKITLRHLEQEIYKYIFLIVRNVTTLQHGSEKRCELTVVKIRHAIYRAES